MGTKEQIGLIVAMFGLYVAVVNRDRKIGLSVAAAGVIWSLVAVFVVEHHYRQPGTLTYVQTRYGYLCGRPDAAGRVHCHGLRGPLHTVLHDPGAIARVVFARPKLAFLVRLLAPLGFVALLAPLSLLLGAPTLLLDIFSSDFHMYSALGDNSAELIAVVVIASILGARVALRPLRGRIDDRLLAGLLAVYLLIAATWSQRAWGFTPLGDSFQAPAVGAHQKLAGRFVAMVPPSVPVATQDQLDPHLASRRYLYLFRDLGDGLAPARFVLLDVSAPT
jgi:hypothetical protein